MKSVLLVQPDLPLPKKTKIDHGSLPIGLLKIGSYLRHSLGYDVRFVRGNRPLRRRPDEIWVTSMFTYWAEQVHDSVAYYQKRFPNADIKVGGVYASLMPEHCRAKTGAEVHIGLHEPAEKWCRENGVDYSFFDQDIDVQILHGMRGCHRKCKFCGTWRIEPRMTFDRRVADRVDKNRVVFYDNNFLKNKSVGKILKELAEVRVNGRRVVYECQSGFDGRILNSELAGLLKEANFQNPRIAWDNSYDDAKDVANQVSLLKRAGYRGKDIYVFILYNWDHTYDVAERKRMKCWEWGVQISDCRFRPLDQTHDAFDARLTQTAQDYHIHEGWTDSEVKLFRKNVRRHNICVRHGFPFHSRMFELMKVPRSQYRALNGLSKSSTNKKYPDAWWPDEYHPSVSDRDG